MTRKILIPRLFLVVCLAVATACAPRGKLTVDTEAGTVGTVESIFIGTTRDLQQDGNYGNKRSEVTHFARFAVSKLPKPHGALKQIVGAERQVVAGMNYRMILILTDGGRWRVQVWKKLDGTMQLSHFKRDN